MFRKIEELLQEKVREKGGPGVERVRGEDDSEEEHVLQELALPGHPHGLGSHVPRERD